MCDICVKFNTDSANIMVFMNFQILNQNKIWGSPSQERYLLELSGPEIEGTTIPQSIINSSPVDMV